jgi:DeoR family transcriptional regulator, suf operon transcriptional repressor
VSTAPSVSESRRGVLDALKAHGEATAEEVAETLGITTAGARQHLAALTHEGLVAEVDEPRPPGAPGRPRRHYSLTARAEPLFPKAYGELANELLGYLEADGDQAVARLFDRRRDARVENARRRLSRRRGFRQKVAELARILDEDGYLADWEALPDGSFRITEHNCAILAVAERQPGACRAEIEFLRTALEGATVERVTHIVAGAHQCAYVVSPPPERAAR